MSLPDEDVILYLGKLMACRPAAICYKLNTMRILIEYRIGSSQ